MKRLLLTIFLVIAFKTIPNAIIVIQPLWQYDSISLTSNTQGWSFYVGETGGYRINCNGKQIIGYFQKDKSDFIIFDFSFSGTSDLAEMILIMMEMQGND